MTNEVLTTLLAERRLALVIGVNASSEAQDPTLRQELKAVADAEAMANILEAQCGFTLFRPPLLGAAATIDQIKDAILDLEAQSGKDDFLLLYFAGHGYFIPGRDQAEIYLVTSNFNERRAERDEHRYVSMSWLRDKLYLSEQAGKVLLIFDCCHAGNFGRTSTDPYLDDLLSSLNHYFGAPSARSESLAGGLRQTFAATGHGQVASELAEHGLFTGHLLQALRGEVDEVIDINDHGKVNLWLIRNYLQRVMPETQKPSLSGDDASKLCVLAQYEERAEAIRRSRHTVATVNERPNTYILRARSPSFQPRPGEFQRVTDFLFPQEQPAQQKRVVGLIGVGGTGKTQLAAELAHLYKEQQRFPSGILWLQVQGDGNSPEHTPLQDLKTTLVLQLASLSASAEYLPEGDDVSHPEHVARRARHLCRYLAQQAEALLVLDNVEDIEQVLEALAACAGDELRCAILYTSRFTNAPAYVKKHTVEGLTVEGALRLLLEYRPKILARILAHEQDSEGQAARAICKYISYLPLALGILRKMLRDEHPTLSYLQQAQEQQGTITLASMGNNVLKSRLFRTFELSWQKVESTDAQRLFKLAASFPEASTIPLWLLGLVAGLAGNSSIEPLGRARMVLQEHSLLDMLPDGETIGLHPLIREFGQLVLRHDIEREALHKRATERLLAEFTNPGQLEQRARAKGYWSCLSDLQVAHGYAGSLNLSDRSVVLLERIAYWLALDSSLLGNSELWPAQIPGLFYQQLYNRALEEGFTLPATFAPSPWLRQRRRIGAQEPLLLRELRHPEMVTSAAFSPDGQHIATTCDDGSARLWDANSGQMTGLLRHPGKQLSYVAFSPNGERLATAADGHMVLLWDISTGQVLQKFYGHEQVINSLVFSSDGKHIATASHDHTARVWDVDSGKRLFFLAGSQAVLDVAFAPDGKQLLALNADNKVFLWDIENEQAIATAPQDEQQHDRIFLAHRGTSALFHSQDGQLLLLDVQSQQATLLLDENKWPVPLYLGNPSLSPDGKLVAMAGFREVFVLSITDQCIWCSYPLYNPFDCCIQFSPDSARLLISSGDGIARIWQIPTQPTSEVAHSRGLRELSFSNDGTLLASVTYKKVCVWLVESDETLIELDVPWETTEQALFWPGGRTMIFVAVEGVYTWDWQQASLKRIGDNGHSYWINYIAISPDGQCILIAMEPLQEGQAPIGIWNTASCSFEHTIAQSGHQGSITAMAFCPDGRHFVTGASDGTARIWDASALTSDAVLRGHLGGVIALCISPDSAMLATADVSGTIYLWSLPTGQWVTQVKMHSSRIVALAFSPDNRLLASSDRSGLMLLWRVRPVEPASCGLYHTPNMVEAIHWPDTHHLVLADGGGLHGRPHFYHLALEGTIL